MKKGLRLWSMVDGVLARCSMSRPDEEGITTPHTAHAPKSLQFDEQT